MTSKLICTKKLLLYFLYNDEIEDTKMINAKLLVAADKYNRSALTTSNRTYLLKMALIYW